MATEIVQKNEKKGLIERTADIAFFAWITVSFFLERDNTGRLVLFAFAFVIGIYMICRGDVYDNSKRVLSAVNPYFVSYVCFIIYNYWHINFSGMVLSRGVASLMFKTMCINFVFIYLVYKYCIIKKDINNVLMIYILAQIVILGIITIQSGGKLFAGRLGSEVGINANSIALLLINCIIVLLHRNSKKRSMFNILLLVVCVFFVLITGSRKGLIGLILGFVLYYGIGGGRKMIKTFVLASIAIAVLYLLIMKVEALYDIVGYRVEALLSYFQGGRYDESSLDTRDRFAEIGWKYVFDKPWFGYGLDNFRLIKGAVGTYSHNNYLELLFGCGIIGTAIYYLGYLYVLIGHIKLYLQNQMDSKPFIVLIIIQLLLEYAYVSYFERHNILFVIIALAALQLQKNKLLAGGISCDKEDIQSVEKSL